MATMPTGQPRTVRDPDKEAYEEMIREEAARQRGEPGGKIGHPGFAESLIPVWGSTREAIADYQDGDYIGAGLNGVLALTDLTGGTLLVKTGVKMARRAAFALGRSRT